jgi:hypothetical protein
MMTIAVADPEIFKGGGSSKVGFKRGGSNTIFSSPELKAQVSFSDHLLSVIMQSVRLSVYPSIHPSVNFSIFDFFSRTTGPISAKLCTNHPWGRGFRFVGHFQGGLIAKM